MGPIFFEPIYQERVWGGRRLETTLGRRLPSGAPIGECRAVYHSCSEDPPPGPTALARGGPRLGWDADLCYDSYAPPEDTAP